MLNKTIFMAKALTEERDRWAVGELHYIESEKHSNYFILNKDNLMFAIDQDTLCNCTGVRDNNEVLIYDSDIVEDDSNRRYRVDYNRYYCKWVLTDITGGHPREIHFTSSDLKTMKVVDNVYNCLINQQN